MKKDNLLKAVKQVILQQAIDGKLTEDWRKQNPNIEPASKLLIRIKPEKVIQQAKGTLKNEKLLLPITKEDLPAETSVQV